MANQILKYTFAIVEFILWLLYGTSVLIVGHCSHPSTVNLSIIFKIEEVRLFPCNYLCNWLRLYVIVRAGPPNVSSEGHRYCNNAPRLT